MNSISNSPFYAFSDDTPLLQFSSTTKRIQYSVQSQRKGDPYREKLKVKCQTQTYF